MNDNDPRENEGRWSLPAAKQVDAAEPPDELRFAAVLARRRREREARVREAAALLAMDRRRQEAARRRPPLGDGRRDPLGTATDGSA